MSWPRVRAALLSGVVAINLLQALPFPTREVEEDEEEGWRADDVAMWHGWLAGAGVYQQGPEAFHAEVIAAYNVLGEVGAVVQFPSRPVFRWLRSTQQWGLFGVVTETPERLVVEILEGDTWRIVERRLDPLHDWDDDIFKYRRVRGTWDTTRKDKATPMYEAFCRWTARRAFRAFPQAAAVRITREQIPKAAPWEVLDDPEPKLLHQREIARDEDRLWVLR